MEDEKSVVVSRKELIEREKQRVQAIIDSIANAEEPVTGVLRRLQVMVCCRCRWNEG